MRFSGGPISGGTGSDEERSTGRFLLVVLLLISAGFAIGEIFFKK